ncbi:hypothetical protein Cni_G18993 [Canna indica]|uniref:Cytochrome P450 n=1 Tax=Canna indica TaxID=4628 RepID=A0AAQ3KK95_9LILI|nr:hypothetical protein Cni_G18993 [Canna indica]
MLSASRLRDFHSARVAAMDRLITLIRAEVLASDDSVWVLPNVRFAFFSILVSITFNVNLDENSIRVDEVMKRVLLTIRPRMDDYIPFLRPFFANNQKKVLRTSLHPQEPQPRAQCAPFSYIDSLLDLKVDGCDSVAIGPELVTLCSDLINGGTNTTSTAIEWAMARIIDNPDIQDKLYKDIVSVVGDRPVDDPDLKKMPNLQAFVKELLRKHPPTYFSLTHVAVEAAKLGGYYVPPDANLEMFLPTIAEDERLRSKPLEFNPKRFISGGETTDVTGSSGIRMILFGAGRRICPGLAIGTTHISLMVWAFEWWLHPAELNREWTIVMKRDNIEDIKIVFGINFSTFFSFSFSLNFDLGNEQLGAEVRSGLCRFYLSCTLLSNAMKLAVTVDEFYLNSDLMKLTMTVDEFYLNSKRRKG